METTALFAFFACFLSTVCAAEGKRIALIIGNGGYTHVPALANPTNDSREISTLLRAVGYEVSEITGGGVKEMGEALRASAIAARRRRRSFISRAMASRSRGKITLPLFSSPQWQ